MRPFLTILTPTYRRPQALLRCMASVAAQTAVEDIEHLILPAYVGRGIPAMFESLKAIAPAVTGRYVHVLGDDDVLASPGAVAYVKAHADEHHQPPMILVRVEKGDLMLPAGEPWPPRLGYIDLGCFVTRADVWKAHVKDYGACYEGDWMFADAVARAGHAASVCQTFFCSGGVGRGVTEAV